MVGGGREETAALVAERFFTDPTAAGVAYGYKFPDSLTGGVHVARRGGPMLLSHTAELHGATADYLCSNAATMPRHAERRAGGHRRRERTRRSSQIGAAGLTGVR